MKRQPISRRSFIRTGLIFVPAVAQAQLATQPCRRKAYSCVTSNAWSNLVVSLGGGVPSPNTVCAIQTIYDALGTAGFRAKILSANAIVPDSLVAACVPFINVAGSNIWTNNNFVNGDLTVNGLKGNGLTTYLDTGIAPSGSIVPSTDFGMTVVSTDSASNGGNEIECGSINTTDSSHNTLLALNLAGSSYAEACGNSASQYIGISQAGNGYYSANRRTTTDMKLYFASQSSAHAQVGSATVSTPTAIASVFYAFAAKDQTVGAAYFSAKRLSFIAVHLGLTSAESATFYSLIAALRTSLGGGNP